MTEAVAEERSEEEVRQTIRGIIAEVAPGGDVEIRSDMNLVEDLSFHSLALLELAFTLEDEFDLPPIDETVARAITTVAKVEQHVVDNLAGRGEIAGRE
ncbi:acyl carrier protein [Saccharomonospora xinjiangensis]|uniref:Acyl carrier protein n=1 Tax=Saccharomonospora cyanea NA-134 TaxID=882082 RepID=H5XHK0_9PSEU|nr:MULTISPECIES: acyl carrier protein [Saccharomonospora]EHR61680.1 acyl carrier protein [Saccharomonospora cyanea NA-134]QBQ60744.1 acyl carrier protein [Saccharomonospora xinjiangensis]